MTRRAVMDDRPDSRGAPAGPAPGTPPSGSAASPAPGAPSPRESAPPTPPLMLATMTPVNVDGYLYEHQQHSEAQSVVHHHHQPVIYSTASMSSLGEHPGLGLGAGMAAGLAAGIPVSVADDAGLMDGAVSVVYQQQVPSNTVVIMSELVDDMSPVLQLRTRRKDPGSPGDPDDGGAPPAPPTSVAVSEADGWRSSLEHPLTAATSAMLNINAGHAEHGAGQDEHAAHGAHAADPPPMTFSVYEYKSDKLGELWPSTSTAGGGAGGGVGVLQLKAANGTGGAGLSGATLDGDLHGLFLQPQQQLLVKREPEDLSHRKQQSSPVGSVGPGLAGGRSSSTGSSSGKLVLANGGDAGPAGDVMDVIKEEYKTMAYSTQMFGGPPQSQGPQGHHGSGTPSPGPYGDLQYAPPAPQQPVYMSPVPNLRGAVPPPPPPTSSASGFTAVSERYYSDYFPPVPGPDQGYAPLRQQIPTYMDGEGAGGAAAVSAADLVQRYVRQTNAYHQNKGVIAAATAAGLTVDLPSPDSGIGAEAITPRDQTAIQPSFDYTDLCGGQAVLDPLTVRGPGQSPGPQAAPGQPPARSRPWHDFGRQNDADKIQIPKVYSNYGFKYTLETPISTSQRREDDRVTYINKGQFYGITMEYIPDPDGPMLKNHTVKSVVMLMFREEKSPEDEIKAWQFWHGRQHSVKQRILDADTKNSMGLVGCIEEVAHNAIAVYWNPLESPAKINVAVQCLSTDFSSQKGVKGLPLHIQIDTYEDPRDGPVYHRGYCQIKVFCDKGAERKTRDEERRAAKRKMTATGRKKLDELYHPAAERSEFYCMADLHKPPVLFTPSEELTSMELQGFYGHDTDNSSVSNGEGGLKSSTGTSPFLLHSTKPLAHQTLKFHNHFPPDSPCVKKEHSLEAAEPLPLSTDGGLFSSPALKRPRLLGPPGPPPPLSHHTLGTHNAHATHGPGHTGHPGHAGLMAHPVSPPLTERVMLYVRQDSEDVYTPLHVVPPSTQGLLNAIENKYKISPSSISNLYRKNKKGITVKIDDEMVKHYCNEDLFILEVKRDSHSDEEELYEVTLIQLPSP